jgi:hypothetical protein
MLVERVLPIALKRLNTIQADALLTDAVKLLDAPQILLGDVEYDVSFLRD